MVLAYAAELLPHDRNVIRAWYARRARSAQRVERVTAREGLARMLGFDLDTFSFARGSSEGKGTRTDLYLLGMLLDSFDKDSDYESELALAEAFYRRYPNRSAVLRNLGRAYENFGDLRKGLDYYLRAAEQMDADDTASTWLGTACTDTAI